MISMTDGRMCEAIPVVQNSASSKERATAAHPKFESKNDCDVSFLMNCTGSGGGTTGSSVATTLSISSGGTPRSPNNTSNGSLELGNMQQPSPFNSNCLQGKVALVTGGGSGIGFEVVKQLMLHGCSSIVICGRRQKFLQEAVNLLRQETRNDSNFNIEYHVCDVRNYDNCEQVAKFVRNRFGRLDILINGAAGNFLAASSNLSAKGFATVIQIDLLGTFNMTRATYSLLAETSSHNYDVTGVSIINISATLQYGATWWQAHASAAKAAIDSLTRSLALEWSTSDRIRVNGIAPGPIANTPGMTKLAPGLESNTMNDLIKEGIPLGRLGESYEIGYAVIYLCSATFVTGHTLVVDGGEWLYKQPKVPKEMVSKLSHDVEAPSRAKAPRSRL